MSSLRSRVGILISGRGSNMVSLVEAMQRGDVDAEPAVVVCNVPGAAGVDRAQRLGVRTEVLDHRGVRPRSEHDRRIVEKLREQRVDWVCLAGYMRLLTPVMIEAYRNRILNIHPSLLPAFPGLHAQRQALEHGVKLSGCTVHLVDEECDHGPIVLQASVPVLDGDDEDALGARILEREHRIYAEALAICCGGEFRIDGRRVLRAR